MYPDKIDLGSNQGLIDLDITMGVFDKLERAGINTVQGLIEFLKTGKLLSEIGIDLEQAMDTVSKLLSKVGLTDDQIAKFAQFYQRGTTTATLGIPTEVYYHLKRVGIETIARLIQEILDYRGLKHLPNISTKREHKILLALKTGAEKGDIAISAENMAIINEILSKSAEV